MTDSLDAAIVDAFTTQPTAGNPAGVVPEATDLTAGQMAAIASELGASETAFVRENGDGTGIRLRVFTPETGVDLCGHATVAAVARLAERGDVTSGTYTVAIGTGDADIEAGAEEVDVEVTDDGTVWRSQRSPVVEAVEVSLAEAAAALGTDVAALSEIGEDLPIARASTGRAFLVVPVGYFEQLSALTPDDAAVEELCARTDTDGVYAFTFDTLGADATVHGRAFAPRVGISEDPVTGTASGATGAYLRQYDAVDAPDPLVFEQGHVLDRPGRVQVRTGNGVAVGGRAVTALEGTVRIPAADDDDIIVA